MFRVSQVQTRLIKCYSKTIDFHLADNIQLLFLIPGHICRAMLLPKPILVAFFVHGENRRKPVMCISFTSDHDDWSLKPNTDSLYIKSRNLYAWERYIGLLDEFHMQTILKISAVSTPWWSEYPGGNGSLIFMCFLEQHFYILVVISLSAVAENDFAIHKVRCVKAVIWPKVNCSRHNKLKSILQLLCHFHVPFSTSENS